MTEPVEGIKSEPHEHDEIGEVDLVFIAGNARSLIANRGDLIRDLQARGIRVGALVPRVDCLPEVRDLGIPIELIDLRRTGLNPLKDLKALLQMIRALRRARPTWVFSYTIKPVVYGTMAARLAGVRRRVAMVTGLGFTYTAQSSRARAIRMLTNLLYRLSLRSCEVVFFQNPDDVAEMIDRNIIKDDKRSVLINGSGVNLDRFPSHPLPKGEPLFLFIGRLLVEKGVAEFVQAASEVLRRWPSARFVAVGGLDNTLPHSIDPEELDHWKASSKVEFIGQVSDVRPWLAQCSVFVLPSYREGTPRSVLEAMATGRPIITTDAPGCRETVVDGVNGLLVAPRDSHALARAMSRYLEEPNMIQQHADSSCELVLSKYEVGKVNSSILTAMGVITVTESGT